METGSDGGEFINADFVGTSEVGNKIWPGLVVGVSATPFVHVGAHDARSRESFQGEEHDCTIRDGSLKNINVVGVDCFEDQGSECVEGCCVLFVLSDEIRVGGVGCVDNGVGGVGRVDRWWSGVDWVFEGSVRVDCELVRWDDET